MSILKRKNRNSVDIDYQNSIKTATNKAEELIKLYSLPTEIVDAWKCKIPAIDQIEKISWGDEIKNDSVVILLVPSTNFPKMFSDSNQGYLFCDTSNPADNSGGHVPYYLWFVTPEKLRVKTIVEFDNPFLSQAVIHSPNKNDSQIVYDYLTRRDVQKIKSLLFLKNSNNYAEDTGVEPVRACAHWFSKPTHYRPAHPPTCIFYFISSSLILRYKIEPRTCSSVGLERSPPKGKVMSSSLIRCTILIIHPLWMNNLC